MTGEGVHRRKRTRLRGYDYSQDGVYFVTTNILHNQCILSQISVGRGLAPAALTLTPLGKIAEQQLLGLSQRYPHVTVDKYVIMPNHVHAILLLQAGTAGASPRPTLMEAVGAFKSLTARLANRLEGTPGRTLWQASFYESVLRTERAYQDAWRYIDANPARWAEDRYYAP